MEKKTYSFEVSIRLLPLCLIVTKSLEKIHLDVVKK